MMIESILRSQIKNVVDLEKFAEDVLNAFLNFRTEFIENKQIDDAENLELMPTLVFRNIVVVNKEEFSKSLKEGNFEWEEIIKERVQQIVEEGLQNFLSR